MSDSVLQFARQFERLKSRLRSTPSADTRLDLLVQFWPAIEAKLSGDGYTSFLDEYSSLISTVLSDHSLLDLLVVSLHSVAEIIESLNRRDGSDQLQDIHRRLLHRRIQLNFYVGEVDQALSICRTLTEEQTNHYAPSEQDQNLTPFERLEQLLESLDSKPSGTVQLLKSVRAEWESARGELHNDRVWCLFVQKDGDGRLLNGQMRQLVGEIEPRKDRTGDKPSDTVTFDHQVKAPNDPFVGVAYDALAAAGKVAFGSTNSDGVRTHNARFSIADSTESFTGDSIGLGFALVSFTQLLKPQIKRHERFIPSDIAFTGSIDEDGRILPINNATLKQKLTRAFFSHITTVVLPKANLNAAQEILNELLREYPNGQLRLIGHDHLRDVTNDLNLVRAERVCLGQFVVRKAYKYSRATKIQVPLLLGLMWLLLALLWPRTFNPLFDRNPHHLNITSSGIEVFNAKSQWLWDFQFECDSIDYQSRTALGNLDEDGRNEVAVLLTTPYNDPCDLRSRLYLFDDDGDTLFSRYCGIYGEYPGDSSWGVPYRSSMLRIDKFRDSIIIMTALNQSDPARTHYRFWNARGDSLGWYINPGATASDATKMADLGDRGLAFINYNNRAKSVGLYVIDPFTVKGVAPPYKDDQYELEQCKPGNQSVYVSFPLTPLGNALGHLYPAPFGLVVISDSSLKVAVSEPVDTIDALTTYSLNSDFRVADVSFEDTYIKTRNKLIKSGHLPNTDLDEYTYSVLNAVTYWTDTGWVTEGDLRALEATQ